MTQTTLKPSEYRCAMCGTIYDFTDFDAEAELAENFPGCSVEHCDIVCDDCFNGLPVKTWSEEWRHMSREEQGALNVQA
jgi:hypothetical protein